MLTYIFVLYPTLCDCALICHNGVAVLRVGHILNQGAVFQMFSSEIVSHYGISPLAEDEEEEEEVTNNKKQKKEFGDWHVLCRSSLIITDHVRVEHGNDVSEKALTLPAVSSLLVGSVERYAYMYSVPPPERRA